MGICNWAGGFQCNKCAYRIKDFDTRLRYLANASDTPRLDCNLQEVARYFVSERIL